MLCFNAAQNSWTNFILHRKCFRLDELFKSTRAWFYPWEWTFAQRRTNKPIKVDYEQLRLLTSSAVLLTLWSHSSHEDLYFPESLRHSCLGEYSLWRFLIPLNSNHLYELLFVVSRVVQIFPNLLLAIDRWVLFDLI